MWGRPGRRARWAQRRSTKAWVSASRNPNFWPVEAHRQTADHLRNSTVAAEPRSACANRRPHHGPHTMPKAMPQMMGLVSAEAIAEARATSARAVRQWFEATALSDISRPRPPPPGIAPRLSWPTKLARDLSRLGDPAARRKRELAEREKWLHKLAAFILEGGLPLGLAAPAHGGLEFEALTFAFALGGFRGRRLTTAVVIPVVPACSKDFAPFVIIGLADESEQ